MDELLDNVGAFGKFQVVNLLLIGSFATLLSMPTYGTIFLLAQPKIRCFYNTSQEAYELMDDNFCHILSNITESRQSNLTTVYSCKYDHTYYGSTLVTEWDLNCKRKYMISLSQTIFMIGTISGIFSGYFGDRFGRRTTSLTLAYFLCVTLILSQVLQLNVFGFSIAVKYVLYCVTQFFIGAFGYCIYITAYVLCIEITTHRYHTRVSLCLLFSFVVGELLIMIISYLARDWVIISWTMTVISILVTIMNHFFLTESPKWLVSQRKLEEANALFRRIAKMNKRKFCEDELIEILKQDRSDNNFQITSFDASSTTLQGEHIDVEIVNQKEKHFLRMLMQILWPPKQLMKTLFLMYVWVAVSLVYYGVGLGITTLDESINPYLIFACQALFEILGYFLSLINDKFGRRKTNMFYFFAAGIICIITAFVPRNKDFDNPTKVLLDTIVIISLTAIGKCVVSASYNTCYVFTGEFYETMVRNFALAGLSCIGQVGSFLAPIVNLLSDMWKPLPYIVFSTSSLFSCLFVFLLPDTKESHK